MDKHSKQYERVPDRQMLYSYARMQMCIDYAMWRWDDEEQTRGETLINRYGEIGQSVDIVNIRRKKRVQMVKELNREWRVEKRDRKVKGSRTSHEF